MRSAWQKLLFNNEKAEEDAKYDGYYCLITSELEMPDQRIIEIYRGLSDIEDNFKVAKSNLDIRSVYASREDRINAHVLTCFISLVIIRLIQKKTDNKVTPEQIAACLNNIRCSLEYEMPICLIIVPIFPLKSLMLLVSIFLKKTSY